jgi:hypothetical protein
MVFTDDDGQKDKIDDSDDFGSTAFHESIDFLD